jgi:hypothetical protein
MRQRCFNPCSPAYHYYGGRGITVCDRWEDFFNFYKDMGDRPEGYSLERIDNNCDYSPDNCKWATIKEQNLNRKVPGGRGYCWVKRLGKYQILIQRNGKANYFGLCSTEKEAKFGAECARIALDILPRIELILKEA